MPATPATTSKEQMGKGLPGQQPVGQGAVGLGERTVAGGQRSEVGAGAEGLAERQQSARREANGSVKRSPPLFLLLRSAPLSPATALKEIGAKKGFTFYIFIIVKILIPHLNSNCFLTK